MNTFFYSVYILFAFAFLTLTANAQKNTYYFGIEAGPIQTKELGNNFDDPCYDCYFNETQFALGGGVNGFMARKLGTRYALRLNFGFSTVKFRNEYTWTNPFPEPGDQTSGLWHYNYALHSNQIGFDFSVALVNKDNYALHFRPGVNALFYTNKSDQGRTFSSKGDGLIYKATVTNVFPLKKSGALLISPYCALAKLGQGDQNYFFNYQDRFDLFSFGIQLGLQFDLSRGAVDI